MSDMATIREVFERAGVRCVDYPTREGWILLVEIDLHKVAMFQFDEAGDMVSCEAAEWQTAEN